MPDAAQPWIPQDDDQLLAHARVLEVHDRTWTSATDPSKTGRFVQIKCPEWVNIIAITPDQQVVLVEQFRHGVERVTIEIPGGMVDPGETPADTCVRELREETGYAGDPVQVIGSVASNPAILTNRTHFGLVRNAVPVAALDLDDGEEIHVRLAPFDQIDRLIADGTIDHSLVVAAFSLLRLRGI